MQTDLNAFRLRYGLTDNAITTTVVPGTGTGGEQGGSGLEAVLDTEWAGAIAPNASIRYVTVGTSDANVDDATYYAIEQNYGGVLSESWGGCELGLTPSDADVVATFGSAASLLGITYLASSGDNGGDQLREAFGVSGLYVNLPAAYPGVTAVGGTGFAYPGGLSFNIGHVASGYGTESVWNEAHNPTTGIAAGGGGISVVFSRPTYQSSLSDCPMVGTLPVSGITPHLMRPGARRGAHGRFGLETIRLSHRVHGRPVAEQRKRRLHRCHRDGGPPQPRPDRRDLGLHAVVRGRRGSCQQSRRRPARQHQPSPLHASGHGRDVRLPRRRPSGDNEVNCTHGTDPGCPAGAGGKYGYPAGTGYDCATGIGSVDADLFVNAISALAATETKLVVTGGPISEGASTPLTATIASPTGTTAIGGAVTFTFQAYLSTSLSGLSWSIDTVPVPSTAAGKVTADLVLPPAMVDPGAQFIDVVAEYGGDAHHQGSRSTKQRVTFNAVGLCMTPATDSVAAGASISFSQENAIGAPYFSILSDSTCDASGNNCSSIDTVLGKFVAGTGAPGYVLVSVQDADGALTYSEITVGAASGAPPWILGFVTHACPLVADGGADSGHDSGSGSSSSGSSSGSSSSSSSSGSSSSNSSSGSMTRAAAVREAVLEQQQFGEANAFEQQQTRGARLEQRLGRFFDEQQTRAVSSTSKRYSGGSSTSSSSGGSSTSSRLGWLF